MIWAVLWRGSGLHRAGDYVYTKGAGGCPLIETLLVEGEWLEHGEKGSGLLTHGQLEQ